MTEHKKTIYKIKFEVEIEITKKVKKTRRGEDRFGYSPKMHIKKNVLFTGFDTSNDVDKIVSNRCAYIEKHFPDQIKDSFAMMFYLEGPALDTPYDDVRSKARKNAFDAAKRMVDQRQRERLPTSKGRSLDKSKSVYLVDKERFITDCVEILKSTQTDGKRLTKTVLGKKYFTSASRESPSRRLKKKLELYEISFEDLIANMPNNLT
jgi:hypothetical protein